MNRCNTKYPILMLHGIGAKDGAKLSCWGTVPYALNKEGARVFFGHQDSWATIEENAKFLKRRILFILDYCGYKKINIIAHSKGGLEARYLITHLGMQDKIASLTTIATPHHGSKTMDILCKYNKKPIHKLLNKYFKLRGDNAPNYKEACKQLSSEYCQEFNSYTNDHPQVYYQSYAAVMNRSFDDFWLALPMKVVNHIDGIGDGMVSVASAIWTNYKGIIPTPDPFGVSHVNAAGIQRTPKRVHKDKYGSIREFYVSLVEDLKNRGY